MARALIADPEQGAMFIARARAGEAVGFATMDWKWSSLKGARIGYLEDLFVTPETRGRRHRRRPDRGLRRALPRARRARRWSG